MTTNEAKIKISEELISRFLEWLKDWDEMPDSDFGWKYGWGKGKTRPKANLKCLKEYMNYIYNGKWLPHWVRDGYPREVIYELNREGWLSYQEYSNWRARNTGHTQWYYISQRTAREIWNAYKTSS